MAKLQLRLRVATLFGFHPDEQGLMGSGFNMPHLERLKL
jgi:hypothetical protein